MADVAPPVRLKALDGIPEPLQPYFQKVAADEGEEYEFRPPVSKTAEDVQRTQNALRKERERAAALAKQVEEMQSASRLVLDGEELDADEVRAMLEERKARSGQEMISKADAQKLVEDLRTKTRAQLESLAKKALDEKDAELNETKGHLERLLITNGIREAAVKPELPFRMKPDAIDDLLLYVKDKNLARVVKGEVRYFDLEGNALEKANGDPADVNDLLALIVPRKPHWLFESQGVGAAAGSTNGAAFRSNQRRSVMSVAEKAAFVEKYGKDKYFQLPE